MYLLIFMSWEQFPQILLYNLFRLFNSTHFNSTRLRGISHKKRPKRFFFLKFLYFLIDKLERLSSLNPSVLSCDLWGGLAPQVENHCSTTTHKPISDTVLLIIFNICWDKHIMRCRVVVMGLHYIVHVWFSLLSSSSICGGSWVGGSLKQRLKSL